MSRNTWWPVCKALLLRDLKLIANHLKHTIIYAFNMLNSLCMYVPLIMTKDIVQ